MKRLRKILLIDDDELQTYLHKRILEKMAVCEQIDCIHEIKQALEYMYQNYCTTCPKANGHDLIFLDIFMPEMSGYEFITKLEDLDLDPERYTIVLLTSSPYARERQKAMEYKDKVAGYMVKPLEKEKIEELMEAIL